MMATLPRRRRLHFTLGAAMIGLAVVAIYLARVSARAHLQRDAARAIVAGGGDLFYDWQVRSWDSSDRDAGMGPPGPSWLHRLIGPEYFETIEYVTLNESNGDDVMPLLGRLPGLRSLAVYGARASDSGLSHIAGLDHLEHLFLSCPSVTDAGLVHLRHLTGLKSLFLQSEWITSDGLEQLGDLPQLEKLYLVCTSVTDAGLVHLRHLTGLKFLVLDGTRITSDGLEQLRDLPQLESLSLDRNVPSLRGLRQLSRLKELSLCNCDRLSDTAFVGLGDLKQLKKLDLRSNSLTDAMLAEISGLTSLEELTLDDPGITDTGLIHLRCLRSLKRLDLIRTQVSGRGLEALTGARSLRVLKLNKSPIDDEGAGVLTQLASLEEVDLSETQISDVGFMRLAGLPKLKLVQIHQTGITKEGMAKLRAKIPVECESDVDCDPPTP